MGKQNTYRRRTQAYRDQNNHDCDDCNNCADNNCDTFNTRERYSKCEPCPFTNLMKSREIAQLKEYYEEQLCQCMTEIRTHQSEFNKYKYEINIMDRKLKKVMASNKRNKYWDEAYIMLAGLASSMLGTGLGGLGDPRMTALMEPTADTNFPDQQGCGEGRCNPCNNVPVYCAMRNLVLDSINCPPTHTVTPCPQNNCPSVCSKTAEQLTRIEITDSKEAEEITSSDDEE